MENKKKEEDNKILGFLNATLTSYVVGHKRYFNCN